MPKFVQWLWRIGLLGIAAIWLYLLITFIYQENTGDNSVEKTVNNGQIVNLKALTIGTPPEAGLDQLYKELDQLTIPELGCTLRLEFIPWGDERKQINIATASGEYDFIPGGVFSDYRTLVVKNAFLNLNDYLNQVPDLVKHYNSVRKDTLERCEINGRLYGLPQYNIPGVKNVGEGFFYREDLRKEWGLDPIIDLFTMEAYLYRAKQEEKYKNEPLITDNRIWTCLWSMLTKGKYIEVSSTLETPFVVVEADSPYVPINRLETPEFKQVLYYIKKWYDDGIIASDMLVASDNEGTRGLNLMLADKKPCETNAPIWSCSINYIPDLYEQHPEWEFGFFDYTLDSAKLFTGSLASNSVISISSKTSNPEIAVKLLEKLHTDKRYYDLLNYGVQGENFNLKDGVLTYDNIPTSIYFPGWTAVTDKDLDYEEVSVNPVWQEEVIDIYDVKVEAKTKTAQYSPLDGFNFNSTNILKYVKKINNAKEESFQPLVCGDIDNIDLRLQTVNESLKAAGLDKYLQELSKQLKKFKTEK